MRINNLKKIVFLLALLLNILPTINNGGVSIESLSIIKAQNMASETHPLDEITVCPDKKIEIHVSIDEVNCIETYHYDVYRWDCKANRAIAFRETTANQTRTDLTCLSNRNFDNTNTSGGTGTGGTGTGSTSGGTGTGGTSGTVSNSGTGAVSTYIPGGSGGLWSITYCNMIYVNCSGSTSGNNALAAKNALDKILDRQNYAITDGNMDGTYQYLNNPISGLPSMAKTLPYEIGYTAQAISDHPLCISDMITQSNTTGVQFNNLTMSDVASFHTHPKGGLTNVNRTGPSAGDFLQTVDMADYTKNATNGTGYTDSYIYAWDGTEYSLHVEDKNQATAFKAAHPELFTTEGRASNAGSWAEGSTFKKQYEDAYKSALSRLNNDNEAHDFAMSSLMAGSGIKLEKKSPTDSSFKEMNMSKSGDHLYNMTKCL